MPGCRQIYNYSVFYVCYVINSSFIFFYYFNHCNSLPIFVQWRMLCGKNWLIYISLSLWPFILNRWNGLHSTTILRRFMPSSRMVYPSGTDSPGWSWTKGRKTVVVVVVVVAFKNNYCTCCYTSAFNLYVVMAFAGMMLSHNLIRTALSQSSPPAIFVVNTSVSDYVNNIECHLSISL